MTATVVPRTDTTRLAKTMIERAKREESGAEAALLHYDDVHPDQLPALIGLLLEEARQPRVTVEKVRCSRCVQPCVDCGRTRRIAAHGMCGTCYQRHHLAGKQIVCSDCGESRRPHCRGMCSKCYQRARRAEVRSQEADEIERARLNRGAA